MASYPGAFTQRLDGEHLRAELTQWLNVAVSAQLSQISDARERAMMLSAKVKLINAASGLPRLRMQFSLSLRILSSLVGILLLNDCVNIVNLLLARSWAHEHEAPFGFR